MTALEVTYTPRPSSLYGRLIGVVDVEQALRARLTARLGDYLTEVERQHAVEVGTIARPRALVMTDERFPEDQLPALVVRSPGTADLPEADGQGRYATRFEVIVDVYVAASAGARTLVSLYALAVRALAVQQPAELYMGVDWVSERILPTELVGGRTIYRAEVSLEAQVADVTDRHGGPPDEPGWPEDPGGAESPEWPVAQSTDVELEKTPIQEDV